MTDHRDQLKIVIAHHRNAIEKLQAKLNEERRNVEFQCECCGEKHAMKDCDVIQTHWYESPHGCMGGDTWHENDIHIVCPKTGHRNRILFNISYDDRLKANPKTRFNKWLSYFASIKMEYNNPRYSYTNNYTFDKNRDFYELN
jgi:hypothetical protein